MAGPMAKRTGIWHSVTLVIHVCGLFSAQYLFPNWYDVCVEHLCYVSISITIALLFNDYAFFSCILKLLILFILLSFSVSQGFTFIHLFVWLENYQHTNESDNIIMTLELMNPRIISKW